MGDSAWGMKPRPLPDTLDRMLKENAAANAALPDYEAPAFRATDDPAVKVSTHPPAAMCDVFGHQWHLFPYPLCRVFNPETGVHLMDTYRAICRRCPVTVLVERNPGEAI